MSGISNNRHMHSADIEKTILSLYILDKIWRYLHKWKLSLEKKSLKFVGKMVTRIS